MKNTQRRCAVGTQRGAHKETTLQRLTIEILLCQVVQHLLHIDAIGMLDQILLDASSHIQLLMIFAQESARSGRHPDGGGAATRRRRRGRRGGGAATRRRWRVGGGSSNSRMPVSRGRCKKKVSEW